MVAMELSLILGKKITLESRDWDGFPQRYVILNERKKRKQGSKAIGARVRADRLPP